MSPLDETAPGPKARLGPYHAHTAGGGPAPPERPLLERVASLEREFQEAMQSLSKAIEELSGRLHDLERKVG